MLECCWNVGFDEGKVTVVEWCNCVLLLLLLW